MNKNSRPPLQFTKLTSEDIHKHRRAYLAILIDNDSLTPGQKGVELCRAEWLFRGAFGKEFE